MNHPSNIGSRMTTAFAIGCLAFAVLLLPFASVAFADGLSNGVYEVQVPSNGAWTTVGTAAFGLGYSNQTVSLPGEFRQVRLVQRGGTAAQLDSASLGGSAPVVVSGSPDGLALQKLQATDHDVTNVYDAAIEITFPVGGSRLELNGRVQGDMSGAFPFEFPAVNTYKPVTSQSAFYSCGLAALPPAIDTNATPFIREWCRTGTGHPDGYTYAWIATDGQNLLATVDFTPDNTMDGNEDYATIHVKTPAGVKEFKISAAEKTWGDVAFTYTDKVTYQHKLYTFKIPLAEIGMPTDAVELSLTTYGTASVVRPVYRFFNFRNGSHFYTISELEKASVIANLTAVYTYEGVAYTLNTSDPGNNRSLYRFYNRRNGSHFYTISEVEKNSIISNLAHIYTYEGEGYDVAGSDGPGATTVYRFFNRKNGSHFYTISVVERDNVIARLSQTYTYEGTCFWVIQ